MDKKPPPYFPQTALSPSDPNRYRKFKLVVGMLVIGVLAILAGIGIGVYYLVAWLAS